MKMIIRNIFIGLIVLLILAGVGICIFTGKAVFDGYTNAVSREETIKNSMEFREDYEDLTKNYDLEKIEIEDKDLDHKVPAIYAKKSGNKNIAVLVHGMGGTKETISPIAKTFLDLGYDVVAYDQRNSHENSADYNTFGVLEANDARAVINHIKEKYPDGNLVLWGESMGALTSLTAAGKDSSNIDYLILVRMGDWYSKVKLGYNFADMDGTTYMKKITVPTLITNSKTDTLTPPYMAEDLYKAKADDKKELITVDNYNHASFAYKDREGYKKIVKDFLEKYPGPNAD